MVTRWTLAVLVGLAVASVVGLLAWLLSPVTPALSGVVFAVTSLPVGITLGWVIFVAPATMPTSPHAEDSIEVTWMDQALTGTATDLVVVIGLTLAAVSITRWELPTVLLLLALLIVAFGSASVRYTLARHRAIRA